MDSAWRHLTPVTFCCIFQRICPSFFCGTGGPCSSAPKPAQTAPKAPVEKPVVGPVEVKAQPAHVGGQVEAFPLVVPGSAVTQAVADKIYAALRREQANADAAAVQCQRDFREQTHRKPSSDVWQRSVEVTLNEPRYLGLVATDEFYCVERTRTMTRRLLFSTSLRARL